ncbi:TPA: hypothetical protein ACH3X1_010636 [Trebouxia sp. C0004]
MMLETLFIRSREQGAASLTMQEQLKTLAAENAALRTTIAEREQKEQHDLQDLRNFCIASQEQSSDKDSSIHADLQQHQQELAGRMSTFEASAREFTASTQKISSRLDTEFKSRLDLLSQKLHGVDNVLGHQLAVHEMAGILGVGVPQVNTSYKSLNLPDGVAESAMQPLSEIQLPPAASAAAPEAAGAATTSAAAEPEQLPPGLLPKPDAALSGLPDLAPAELAPAEHAVASPAIAAQNQKSISTGLYAAVPSPGAARAGGPGLLPQLKVQIETLEDKELEIRLHVEMLRDDMSLLKKEMQTSHADISSAVSITSNIDGRFHMLESEMHGYWKKMKDDESAKADKAAAASISSVTTGKASDKVSGQVAWADLSAFQDQVRASFEGIHDLKDRLDKTDKQLAAIQSSCLNAASTAFAEAKVVTGGLQEQLGSLQQDMRSVQYKVESAVATVDGSSDDLHKCATAINDLAYKVRHKLGPEDINRITHKAAAAAEAALHQTLTAEDARDKSAAGASRFRCLSCDTDLQLQRNMQQGRPPIGPSLLPKLIGPGAAFTSLHSSSDPGGQCTLQESLHHSPRHSSSPDTAVYTSISLPELPADYSSGRLAAPSLKAPLAAHTLTPALVTPGAAAMPPSLAARWSPTPALLSLSADSADVHEGGVSDSGLPRQMEGVTSGDRRSPMVQLMRLDKRARQTPPSKNRPQTPIFTV